MFPILSRILSRSWMLWLAAWALSWAGTRAVAPRWNDVAQDGQFNFLPRNVPSRRGERLLRDAFPGRARRAASSSSSPARATGAS